MKKFVAIVMMVILVMSLTVTAQAERFCGVAKDEVTNPTTGEVESVRYLVGIQYDMDTHGELVMFEIDENAYNRILEAEEHEREIREAKWYRKAAKWCATSASNVADWVTFWN